MYHPKTFLQERFSKAVYMCVPVDSERESRLDRRIGPNKGYVHGISFGAAAYAAGEPTQRIRKWAQRCAVGARRARGAPDGTRGTAVTAARLRISARSRHARGWHERREHDVRPTWPSGARPSAPRPTPDKTDSSRSLVRRCGMGYGASAGKVWRARGP